MHTLKATNGTIFHFNSDFSGDVHIITPEPNPQEIQVNGDDLLELSAHYILSQRIEALEDTDWRYLLR